MYEEAMEYAQGGVELAQAGELDHAYSNTLNGDRL
jgi:hypothetical protein